MLLRSPGDAPSSQGRQAGTVGLHNSFSCQGEEVTHIKTGKNQALTPSEMDMMNRDLVIDNHLYDVGGSRAGTISEIVSVIGSDVIKERAKIDLRDTAEVKRIAAQYIESCQRVPVLPSKSGLCRSLGYSRQGLWLFMRDNGNHPTTDFLERLFDGFSETYDIAAMGGTIHPVYAIFTQKAQYGLVDNPPQEELPAADPLGSPRTPEEIEALYRDLPDE